MDVYGQTQHLHEMITAAHGVLLEARNLNLKQPLQSNASLFNFADMDHTPSSPGHDGSAAEEKDEDGLANLGPLTLTGDEIQDSLTKIAALKGVYMRHCTELLESLHQKKEDVASEDLLARRDQLRKDVHARNVVMKGLIDRLRLLQHALSILHGRDQTDSAANIVHVMLLASAAEDHIPFFRSIGMDLAHHINRDRSSSAKWANDTQLAFEYLKRQAESVEWLEKKMDTTFPTHDLHELLKSGVLLRELMQRLSPTTSSPKPIARQYSATMAPWKERENISLFLSDCKRLGMSDLSLFGTDDLYEGTNMVAVVFGLQYIKSWFTGGIRSPRSPKAPTQWSFTDDQVDHVLAHFRKHKSQEALLQGFLRNAAPSSVDGGTPSVVRGAELTFDMMDDDDETAPPPAPIVVTMETTKEEHTTIEVESNPEDDTPLLSHDTPEQSAASTEQSPEGSQSLVDVFPPPEDEPAIVAAAAAVDEIISHVTDEVEEVDEADATTEQELRHQLAAIVPPEPSHHAPSVTAPSPPPSPAKEEIKYPLRDPNIIIRTPECSDRALMPQTVAKVQDEEMEEVPTAPPQRCCCVVM
ncbi:Aste57867_1376 [Aphanomyces stellatus]|uniref:Aste57867_1376 protein n=1 Tax=Aphanomyces stellatus TaxID=120398 RepID=A0A485K5G7_9STRA|nr:hypothetical protein As57867_001375 [Aphanomyces stellatus]VFT78594.1 Aste57867_1376 [Aphanomyces stellatus]